MGDEYNPDSTNSSAVQSCHEDEAPNAAKDNNDPCKFSSLKITSGKKTFQIDDDSVHQEGEDKKSMDLVCGYSGNLSKVSLELIGAANCTQNLHENKLVVNAPPPQQFHFPADGSFDAKSVQITDGVLGYSPTKLWPFAATPNIYGISATSCQDSCQTAVRVWPDVKWKVSFSFKYNEDEGGFKYEKRSISFKYNGLEKTWDKNSGKDESFLEKLFDFLDKLEKLYDYLTSVEDIYHQLVGPGDDKKYGWKSLPMAIEISLDWGWADKDSPSTLCNFPISGNLALDPLLGVSYTADVLSWICNAWPGFGTLIDKIRKSQDNVQLSLDFEFIGKIVKKGQISVVLNKDFIPAPISIDGAGSPMEASLSFKLTGRASIDLFIVKGTAEISGSTSFTSNVTIGFDSEGTYFMCPLTFTGLKIVAVVYKSSDAQKTLSADDVANRSSSKDELFNKELVNIGSKTWGGDKIYVNK